MKTTENNNEQNLEDSFNDYGFEVLDHPLNEEIKNLTKYENIEIKNENQSKTTKNTMIRNILRIIFNSRDLKENFHSKSKKNTNNLQNSFDIDIDDLLLDEYENLADLEYKKNYFSKKKYIIEFYLIDPENKSNKLLVEKWKIKYRDEGKNSKDNLALIERQIKTLEKSITTYGHILPLYSILKTHKYEIDFKFYQNKSVKTNHFYKKHENEVELKNMNLFGFGLKIEYLGKKDILTGFELVNKCISFDKRDRCFSISLKKNENLQIFNECFGNQIIEEGNILRKLSCENIDNENKNNISLASPSSSDSSDYESCNEISDLKNPLKVSNNKKLSEYSNSSNYITDDCSPKMFRNSNKTERKILSSFQCNNINSNNNNIGNIKNHKIKSILTEFHRVNDLLDKNSKFDNFNVKKLAKFVINS